jgi:hypothetical protein
VGQACGSVWPFANRTTFMPSKGAGARGDRSVSLSAEVKHALSSTAQMLR